MLQTLENDFQVIGNYFKEFSSHVLNEQISDYPIYVASQEVVPIGKPFLSKEHHKLNWNYNATILEDLVSRELISRENVKNFTKAFGDPLEKACLFVVLKNEASFIFLKYGQDDVSSELYPDQLLN